jgi:hypothetical protein
LFLSRGLCRVRNEGNYEADMNYEDDARLWIVIPIYQLYYTGDIKTSKLGLNLKLKKSTIPEILTRC